MQKNSKSSQSETKFGIELVRELSKNLSHFEDGRIDYSKAEIAPIVTCFIMHNNKIFLAKRGKNVRTYKGKWCTVAGYYDRAIEAEKIALMELEEEASIAKDQIDKVIEGTPFSYTDDDYGITWIVHPFLFVVNGNEVALDWEHEQMRWINPDKLPEYETVPMLQRSLDSVLENLKTAQLNK